MLFFNTIELIHLNILELRECFNMFDKDMSGSITTAELKGVCESLNLKLDAHQLNTLMSKMDIDNSGSIDFKEFTSVMAKEYFKPPTTKELELVFDNFDIGSKRIQITELFCNT